MKIFKATYDDLNSMEKEYVPNNGGGKEYASYIVIEEDDESRRVYSDAMEPEDARFYRDLSWIIKELKKAYGVE